MNVVFRADASLQIGTGHVVRCLTLATSLRNRGVKSFFVCREFEGNLIPLIRQRGFEVIVLPMQDIDSAEPVNPTKELLAHGLWLGTDWASDADQTKNGIRGLVVNWLVVDHYALDARWESSMRSQCHSIMVIDDIADRPHKCDLLLDQNLFGDMNGRYKDKIPLGCIQMLGPKYALLQSQYSKLHSQAPARQGCVRRILVYFGGADTNNLTGMAVAAFFELQRKDITLDVVVNASNKFADALDRQIGNDPRITLHKELPSLAHLMVKADLAIGAGGATSWERCCLGLPTIVITLAKNQEPIAAELERRGVIKWLGDGVEVDQAILLDALENVCQNGIDSDWSTRCSRWVDGKGTERLASALVLDAKTKIKARLARADDEDLILEWGSDHSKNSGYTTGETNLDVLSSNFREKLRDIKNCRFYIIETECGLPIGRVTFEWVDNGWMIACELIELASRCSLEKPSLKVAMAAHRDSVGGMLRFSGVKKTEELLGSVIGSRAFGIHRQTESRLSIGVCTDEHSWINDYVFMLILNWLDEGHYVSWAHGAENLPSGDMCFYLSYSRIVESSIRNRFRNNLVVHESDLPKGRGWSPMSWQILEGKRRVPVTLIEAIDQVDAGAVYLQTWIELDGSEIFSEWRELQARATISLCQNFVDQYPDILKLAKNQQGEATFYPRRRPNDGKLNPAESIAAQFNLLRISDNTNYPAFFEHGGVRYVLRIERAI